MFKIYKDILSFIYIHNNLLINTNKFSIYPQKIELYIIKYVIDKKYLLYQCFKYSTDNLFLLTLIKSKCIDFSLYNNYSILFAAKHSYLKCLKELLKNKKLNPKDNNKAALFAAINFKRIKSAIIIIHYSNINIYLHRNKILKIIKKSHFIKYSKSLMNILFTNYKIHHLIVKKLFRKKFQQKVLTKSFNK
jgi:hypothetical protein